MDATKTPAQCRGFRWWTFGSKIADIFRLGVGRRCTRDRNRKRGGSVDQRQRSQREAGQKPIEIPVAPSGAQQQPDR
jgi:hypothetical protein